ncbi:MAG: TIGR02281 family clan AA aspartic protease [Pseudomonadota bacterium]|jgi:aspartyl protease family protein
MAIDPHHWQPLLIYAAVAAVLLMVLQRLPVIGRFVRLAFSAALLAFMIFLVLQMAPYQPELSRLTGKLGLDDQQVSGKELRVAMSTDGHFWVRASINGVDRRMLIDSGATITALSASSAREAKVDISSGFAPVVLQTANGAAPARAGRVDELRIGNIVARNLRIVTSPGLGEMDVLGMNFLSRLQSWRVEGQTLVLVPHHPQNAAS